MPLLCGLGLNLQTASGQQSCGRKSLFTLPRHLQSGGSKGKSLEGLEGQLEGPWAKAFARAFAFDLEVSGLQVDRSHYH